MLFRGFYQQTFNTPNINRVILSGANVMPKLHEYLTHNMNQTFVITDVSGWDHLRCRFLIKDVFYRVFKPLIIFDEEWQDRMFEYIVEDFIFTSLLLPDGSVFTKTHGVPSGSFLTLLFNSIGNYIVQTSILQRAGIQYYHPKVLGDDFSFLTDTWLFPTLHRYKQGNVPCH